MFLVNQDKLLVVLAKCLKNLSEQVHCLYSYFSGFFWMILLDLSYIEEISIKIDANSYHCKLSANSLGMITQFLWMNIFEISMLKSDSHLPKKFALFASLKAL